MADANTLAPAPPANKPAKVFRIRALLATIFPNRVLVQDGEVVFHKVTLQRTYKDGDKFKTTTIIGRDDLCFASVKADG